MIKPVVLPILSVLALVLLQAGCDSSKRPLSYQSNIKPILDTQCVSCHVPGGTGFEQTGLRLDSYDALMKGTKFNPVVVPGSSVSSTLYRLISGKLDPSISMPHGQATLPEADIATIAAWIDRGAVN